MAAGSYNQPTVGFGRRICACVWFTLPRVRKCDWPDRSSERHDRGSVPEGFTWRLTFSRTCSVPSIWRVRCTSTSNWAPPGCWKRRRHRQLPKGWCRAPSA